MKEINLQLTIEEANLILEALGNLPFVKVYALISKIQAQAGQQLNGNGAPDKTDSAPAAAPSLQG
jgi:hypothetical protein